MQKDSILNIILVGVGLCIVCGAVISTVAVSLRDQQEQNVIFDQQSKIIDAARLLEVYPSSQEALASIEEVVVNLNDGEPSSFPPEQYDLDSILRDSSQHTVLNGSEDIAMISVRENLSKVYIEYRNNELKTLILPVRGYGLWGTLYGYLALDSDLNTIVGLEFYKHKETPGLGAEVDNPNWKKLWNGKKVFDENGLVQISVIKGFSNPQSADYSYEVDGLSGATITSKGVSNLLAFWLGNEGFGPFINNLKNKEIQLSDV
jgi:Na+-transporting NADH:ubiquinone oxidoreductase subunit C|tara:strand:+ start:182 stop:964 length:783 start_codon:yes stop_codon:yes gene_type:complete